MRKLVISAQNSLEEIAAKCKKNGYGIEVLSFCSPKYLEHNPNGLHLHKKAFCGIDEKTIHGPFTKLQPGSADEGLRKRAYREILYSLRMAWELKAENLVVHHGEVLENTIRKSWIEQSIAFWNKILEQNKGRVKIRLENMRDSEPDAITEIVLGTGNADFDVCLDIGHANCYSHIPVVKWIERMNRAIGYVHLHNNDGENDNHHSFSKGTIDMQETCDALLEYAPDSIWVVEVHDEYIDDSVNWLVKKGYI